MLVSSLLYPSAHGFSWHSIDRYIHIKWLTEWMNKWMNERQDTESFHHGSPITCHIPEVGGKPYCGNWKICTRLGFRQHAKALLLCFIYWKYSLFFVKSLYYYSSDKCIGQWGLLALILGNFRSTFSMVGPQRQFSIRVIPQWAQGRVQGWIE